MNVKNLKFIIMSATLITNIGMAQTQSIERVTMQPIKVIYVSDTANATQEISTKMGKGYGILFSQVGKLQLQPKRTMGIYHTGAAPWMFDVAVEVDRQPDQLSDGVKFKTLEGGDAIVVHFKGPYEQVSAAYQQMEEWLKKNGKQRAGAPIEVYINDPATVKDKSELLTDIYQRIQ